MSKWISVEERPPRDGDEAWVYYEQRRGMCVARAHYNMWTGWVRDGDVGEILTGVTLYQPIVKPAPPSTEQSDSTLPELVVEYDLAVMDG